MAKYSENKRIPVERMPTTVFLTEYLFGELTVNNNTKINTVKSRTDIARTRLMHLGLECVMLDPNTMKGICKICGDTGTPYTDSCDGEKHDAYYSQFTRSN